MSLPSKIYDLVRFSTSTTGTGTMAVGSAVAGLLTPGAAGASDGDVISYVITDGVSSEIGQGTYHTASGGTVSRDTVYLSTASGAKISLSGNATVSFVMSSRDFNALLVAPTPISFSPVDTSGAGLVFATGTYMSYQVLGPSLVQVDIEIVYPTTSDTTGASFSLPFPSYAHPTFLGFGTSTSLVYCSGGSAYLYTFGSNQMRNVDMSGKNINASIVYRHY